MTHKVLIVGAGSIGKRHVACMLATGRCRVGVCEPHDEAREEVASRYDLVAVHLDLDTALNEHWDAAVVAVPAPQHIPIARRLAERGVGILIEKPLAVDEAGVEALVKDVDARRLTAAVAYVYRAHPAAQAVHEALRSRRFGRPLNLVAVSGQPFAVLRPAYRDIYYAKHEAGGGAIQDGATHVFNLCSWLIGPIERLAVDADRLGLDGVEVEDTVHVLARHRDEREVLAVYAVNHHQAPNESFLTIHCEWGSIRLDIKRHRWHYMTEPLGEWHEEAFDIAEHNDWFTRQEHGFLDCLEGKSPPLCSLREGWHDLRVNRAALRSASRGGDWQHVDLVAGVQPTKRLATVLG